MDGDRLTNPGVVIVTGPELPGDPESLIRASAFVERPRLLRRLGAAAAPVVLLKAPSGYGKSVLLGQWAAHDSRPFASIILDDRHNDPAMLVASIVGALDKMEAVGPEGPAAPPSPEPKIPGPAPPRPRQLLDQGPTPCSPA